MRVTDRKQQQRIFTKIKLSSFVVGIVSEAYINMNLSYTF
jgi:hypothetical protein